MSDEPAHKCTLCGAPMYITDHGNHETIWHCSSKEAEFWSFDRGTFDQARAKKHWDCSRREIFRTVEDALGFIARAESLSSKKH